MARSGRLVTATEFATLNPDVSIHLIAWWRTTGKITVRGHRGRSPLYDWDELCTVEAETRASGKSHRRARAAA